MKTCGCPSDTLGSLLVTPLADRARMSLGMGGVASGLDALELVLAGASEMHRRSCDQTISRVDLTKQEAGKRASC